jgi:hypothetical protein
MLKKIKIAAASLAALMLAILAVNLVMAVTTATNTPSIAANKLGAPENVTPDDNIVISPEQAENTEQLRELNPATLEEAERSIYPLRSRFIMWTNDGVHLTWSIYGNCRFVGTDNLGKRCWRIYGKGIFAGFYDGEFFWGKYDNGAWKAKYLFGIYRSAGS